MPRFAVPGPKGGWFDLIEVSDLTPDHQDEYLDLADKLRDDRRRALELDKPYADDPGGMPDPAEVRVKLTRKDIAQLEALAIGFVLTGSSYEGVYPWTAESRSKLPLPAYNRLNAAMETGYYGALNGQAPKEETPATSTSSNTSPDAAQTAPPEPAEP